MARSYVLPKSPRTISRTLLCKKSFFYAVIALGLTACSMTWSSLDTERAGPQFDKDGVLNWNELLIDRGDAQNINVEENQNIVETPEKEAVLHPKIRNQATLKHIAINRSLKNAVPYAGGVYGKIGSAVYFAATTDVIPDWNRLYWVVVKVLSEKYGCFMRKKITHGDITIFVCADQRRVVFWRAKEANWIQFHARQFDSSWRELIVNNRRVSERRSLYSRK